MLSIQVFDRVSDYHKDGLDLLLLQLVQTPWKQSREIPVFLVAHGNLSPLSHSFFHTNSLIFTLLLKPLLIPILKLRSIIYSISLIQVGHNLIYLLHVNALLLRFEH